MTRFDEEPDGDLHGECTAEIDRLTRKVEELEAECDDWRSEVWDLREEVGRLEDMLEAIELERTSTKTVLTWLRANPNSTCNSIAIGTGLPMHLSSSILKALEFDNIVEGNLDYVDKQYIAKHFKPKD